MFRCRMCGKDKLDVLIDFGSHPITHRFLASPSEKAYVHNVIFCFCDCCGLLQLVDPIPAEALYENYACPSSWKHQPHVSRLIRLIEDFIRPKRGSFIVEVGSNDGRFLAELKKHGYKNLIGIEPAKDAAEAAKRIGVKTARSFFTKRAAEEFVKNHGRCELLISRQTLEHVQDLDDFSEAMRIILSPGGFVLFEVPDFDCGIQTLDYTVWDEHVNYFTPDTLNYFFQNSGIRLLHQEKVLFSGQAILAAGVYNGDTATAIAPDYIKQLSQKVLKYQRFWPVFKDEFIGYLRQNRQKRGRIAAYGAGSRLCSLINFTSAGPYIDFIVDDQPEKQSRYMPGSRLPIVASDILEKENISLCLLGVNTECEDMVMAKHCGFEQKGGSFVSVLPPSNRLPDFWNDILYERVQIKEGHGR